MRKRFTRILAALALLVFMTPSLAGWGQDQQWNHTFSSPEAINNNAITVGGATWNVSTTAGDGSPTISTGTYSQTYGLKFGSSKSNYFGSVTFATDYFTNYNVKSVTVNILNNGSKQGTLTAQQGNTSMGSTSATFGQIWTNLTVNTTPGSGGSFSFTYSVEQAFYIHSISVTYTTGPATYTVTYNGNGATSGDVPVDDNGYELGDEVTVLGNTGDLAKTGHTFVGWNTKADGSGTTFVADESFNITADTTLYAKWTTNSYAYSIEYTGETGHATAQLKIGDDPAGANIPYNTDVTIVMTSDEGYTCSASVKDPNNNNVAVTNNHFTMPASAVTVTVNVLKVYTVSTPTVANGSVAANPASGVAGTTIALTATPDAGYMFEAWDVYKTDDIDTKVTVTNNQFTMPAYNVTATATFVERTATFTEGEYWAMTNDDDDWGNFMAYNVSGDQVWEYYTSNSFNAAYMQGYVNGAKANEDWLISPRMTAENGKLMVSFLSKRPHDGNLVALYSTDYDGYSNPSTQGTWTSFGATIATSNSWTESGDKVITGTNIYVAFKYTSTTSKAGEFYVGDFCAKQYYPVAYDANGGSGMLTDDDSPYVVGGTVTVKSNGFTAPSGSTFKRWNTAANGSGNNYEPNETFNMGYTPVTLYAQWGVMHNITYPASYTNGSVTTAPATAFEGDEVTIVTVPAEHYHVASMTATGLSDYTINGNNITFTMSTSDVTISAITFAPTVHTVTYMINGVEGTGTYAPVEVNDGESIATLPTGVTPPTGYVFVGWTASESNVSLLGSSYTPTANATLYAVFSTSYPHTYSFSITTSDFNGTSYAANNNEKTTTATSSDGGDPITVKWTSYQVMNQSSAMQWQSSNGCIYNSTDLGTITDVSITSSAGSFTTYYGTSAQPTSSTIVGNGYFQIKVGSSTGKSSKVEVTFTKGSSYYTLIKDITVPETMANVYTSHILTVKNGGVLTVTGNESNCTPANLIIEDGGQLICNNPVNATLQKGIEAAVLWGVPGADAWYFIASPVNNYSTSTIATGIASSDLYCYNEEYFHWYNAQGEAHPFTTLTRGQGYLYANNSGNDLSFLGTMPATNTYIEMPLSYASSNEDLKGFNLMGNPFTCNLTSDNVKVQDGETLTSLTTYYIVENGTEITSSNIASNPIKPGRGFMIQADGEGQKLVFNPGSKRGETNNKPSYLSIEAGNAEFMDRAYVQIGQGNTLRKMTINDQVSHVYVMNDGKDYAAATIEEARGEMPVNFKAHRDGQYTITVNPENVEMGYLHLIDNIAGTDIDLLANPSYTFNAKGDDYESRFRLVFSANMVNTDLKDDFAFFSNGQLVIANEGESLLQVIDVNGRIVMTESVSGTCSKAINVKAGVYVLRLINGTDVKTQKIVIR